MFWALIRARKSLCVLTWGMLFTFTTPGAHTEGVDMSGLTHIFAHTTNTHPAPHALQPPSFEANPKHKFETATQEHLCALVVQYLVRKRWISAARFPCPMSYRCVRRQARSTAA